MSKYNEKSKEATIKYIAENLKRIEIRFPKKEYEEFIAPAIERSGKTTAAFIKDAIYQEIERMS